MQQKDEALIAAIFEMGFKLARDEGELRGFMRNEKNAAAVNLLSEPAKIVLREKYARRRDALRRVKK